MEKRKNERHVYTAPFPFIEIYEEIQNASL
jgi:hypothetical protein